MFESVPIYVLALITMALILVSAFFSSSETGLMAINRYRLRHLAKTDTTAARIKKLLSRPDKFLGVILIGNTVANVGASAIATIIGDRMYGDTGVILSEILIILIILIFAEIAPKTIAAIRPNGISYFCARPLQILLWVFSPIVWFCNSITNIMLTMIGINKINPKHLSARDALNTEELKTLILDAPHRLSEHYQQMLLGILELEQISVDEIMIPCHEVIAIDLTVSNAELEKQLQNFQYTMVPLYEHRLDNIQGVLHIKDLNALQNQRNKITADSLREIMRKPYFIPEGTTLYIQLLQFRLQQEKFGCIVNEYGELLGIITLEDLLAEIVGEFTTDWLPIYEEITPQSDGSYLVDGSLNIREINRKLDIKLPISNDAKTISGLITKRLENIPNIGTCIKIDDYPIEVIKIQDNMVKIARIILQNAQKKTATI